MLLRNARQGVERALAGKRQHDQRVVPLCCLPLLATVLPILLTACATAPLSFIDARPVEILQLDEYAVRIVSVDGEINFNKPNVQVHPGPRMLVLQADGFSVRTGLQQSFVMRIEPCTRYHLIAKRATPIDKDWKVVVQRREPVAGCDAKEEMEKARKAGLPG
jgi:hypothetical protein